MSIFQDNRPPDMPLFGYHLSEVVNYIRIPQNRIQNLPPVTQILDLAAHHGFHPISSSCLVIGKKRH